MKSAEQRSQSSSLMIWGLHCNNKPSTLQIVWVHACSFIMELTLCTELCYGLWFWRYAVNHTTARVPTLIKFYSIGNFLILQGFLVTIYVLMVVYKVGCGRDMWHYISKYLKELNNFYFTAYCESDNYCPLKCESVYIFNFKAFWGFSYYCR